MLYVWNPQKASKSLREASGNLPHLQVKSAEGQEMLKRLGKPIDIDGRIADIELLLQIESVSLREEKKYMEETKRLRRLKAALPSVESHACLDVVTTAATCICECGFAG